MNSPSDDVGEATTTLPDPRAAASQKVFFARIGMVLLMAGLLYLVWRIVTPLWQPLLWAMLLGSLLAPLNSKLATRLGGKPKLASAITLVGVVLLVLLPIFAIGGAVAVQASQLLGRIDTSALRATEFDLADIPLLARPLEWLDATAGISLAQIDTWVVTRAKRLLEIVASSGGAVFLGAIGTLVSFILMLFVLFFMLRDGPRIAQTFVRMLPIETHLRSRLWRHLRDVTRAVFMGIGLTALVQGTLLGIGFAIAGLPSPLLFGVLGALFALVPIVGTAIVWVPATLWLLSQDQPYYAIFMLAWGVVVVGAVDNFLRPILISGRTEVPTLAVFVGVMGGLSAFGFIGLFLGPIVLGLLVALFRFTSEELAPGSNEA
ncbi:MAG: AI-2E family transporter [Gammaproteobacteria bacterium]|nr:AI-2E family transporter [Gammaproteobacteria bacterium]MDH4310618.1 AI-2E family transporter [Gammaproteobacteria bacterium]MDH5271810.1 AI-2E family transporter [Gammaproteobacteria bacterium]